MPLSDFLASERENSGLNVTCACRVFLIEPTVNHAFEIQGRLDNLEIQLADLISQRSHE